ncbi:FAD-dependent oxidoreductase [soil metagenome]
MTIAHEVPASVAIVGGGLAGFTAAQELRKLGFEGRLSIIDAGEDAPYDRPPLSKDFLTGTATVADLQLANTDWYDTHSVDLLLGHAATALSRRDRAVVLDDQTSVQADAILLATGGSARRLPIDDGATDSIHVLRTMDDAVRLRAALVPGARLLIIGAGLIGAETASAAQKLGAQVTLVDPSAPPLVPVLGPEIAAYLHEHHARSGIRAIVGSVAEFVRDARGALRSALLTSGEKVEFDLVLVGIGITPNLQLAESAGLELENGVIVDESRRSSDSHIFAAGDISRVRAPGGSLSRRDEHWEAARIGGAAAARGILGLAATHEAAHWFWSDREGIHLEVAGSMTAPGTTVFRGSFGDDSFALFRIDGGRLIGAASINDSMAVRAARRIIDAQTPVDALALGDPSVNLRQLAKR